jgi:vacuolar-type H+-ATPase subunit E/Vma4
MADKDGKKIEALCREVLDTVIENIDGEFRQMPRQLTAIAEEKVSHFETEMATLIKSKSAENARTFKTALSKIRFKSRQHFVQVLDESVAHIISEGYKEALEVFKAEPGGQFVKSLTFEAVNALGGDGFLVRVPAETRKAVGVEFLEELTEQFRKRGRKVNLEFDEKPLDKPGVVVCCKGGRVSFDNTIEDRFRRSRKVLFTEVKSLVIERSGLKDRGRGE